MIKTIARYTVLGGIFIIPFIPFLVTTSMFFPFITGKNFAFRIIVDLILAAWGLLAIIDPMYRPKRSPIAWAMLAFLVVIGIADAFGANPVRSFWSNYERMEGFMAMLHLGAYFLVVGATLTSERLWRTFFNTSVIAAVAMSFYAFAQLAGLAAIHQGDIRVDATLGNASYLAVYLLIHIFLTLILAYWNRTNKPLMWTYMVGVAIEAIALFYTGTRGAILGVIGGVILAELIMLIWGKEYPRLRKMSGIALAAVILLTTGFFLMRSTSVVKNSVVLSRVANISLQDTTVQSRFLLWTKIGWEGFKERPLLGWGQDNFIIVFGKYYDPQMYKQEPWFDRAHNVFMDWLIAGGALGLLAYLFLFGTMVYTVWKTKAFTLPEKSLLIGLLAAYFFHNIFVFDNLISYVFFFTLLAYAHARSLSLVPSTPLSKEASEGIYVVTGGAIVLGALLVYFVNVPYIERSRALIGALTYDYRQEFDQVLPAYEKALAYGGLGIEEAKEQLSQSAIKVWGQSDVKPEVKQALVLRAKDELEKSVKSDPGNTRPLFFLGYLTAHTFSPEQGIAILKEALAINPSRQNFMYEIARVYLALGKFDEVIATFKEAYDKDQTNEQAFTYYVGALIYDGKVKEGQQALLEHLGTTTVDNDILYNAYLKQNMYKETAQILVLRLANMQPGDDARTRAQLGLLYLQMGDRAAAVEQIQRAIDLDATFAPQGKQILEQIKAGKSIRLQ